MTTDRQPWSVPGGLPAGGFIVPQPRSYPDGAFSGPALWITEGPVPGVGPL